LDGHRPHSCAAPSAAGQISNKDLDDKLVAKVRMQHTDREQQCSIMSFHVAELLYNPIAPNFDSRTEGAISRNQLTKARQRTCMKLEGVGAHALSLWFW